MVNAPRPSATRLSLYLNDGLVGHGADELGAWLAASPRFAAFAQAHRDKIRKKLRGATDDAARLDVKAELRVAQRLLADRRIELAFEPGGSARGGPDFRVTFRSHTAFNLEVTHPRAVPDSAALAKIVLAKLRQLPPGTPNVLLIAVDTPPSGSGDVADAVRRLRSHAEAGDAATLTRGGFASPREFFQRYLRLGGVITWCETADNAGAVAWTNPSARMTVPDGALRACLAALAEPSVGGQRG
jgi:hypothetical protein